MTQPFAKLMLEAAEKDGLSMTVYYAGMAPDYEGTDAAKAWEAVEACDEMHVQFKKEGTVVAWAFMVPGLDPDETVADCSGEWADVCLKSFDAE